MVIAMIEATLASRSSGLPSQRWSLALAWVSVGTTLAAIPLLFIEVFGMSFLGIEESFALVVGGVLLGQVTVSTSGLVLGVSKLGGRGAVAVWFIQLVLAFLVLSCEFWALAAASEGWHLNVGLAACSVGTTVTSIQALFVLRSLSSPKAA